MWPFSGKGGGGIRRVPTERVVSLSSQGMPDTEIINVLKNEGYTPLEVDSAMKQALRGVTGGSPRPSGLSPPPEPFSSQAPPREAMRPMEPGPSPPGPFQETPPPGGMPPPAGPDQSPGPFPDESPPELPGLGMPPLPGDSGFSRNEGMYSRPGAAPGSESAPQPRGDIGVPDIPPSSSSPGARETADFEPMEPEPLEPVRGLPRSVTRREGMEDRRRQIEELIEGIVDERWNDFRVELGDIMTQFNTINARISRLEQSAKSKGTPKDSSLDALEKRMESYNSSVEEISSRMSAMENAIKSSMTPMMQTLRSLSDTVRSLKGNEEGS